MPTTRLADRRKGYIVDKFEHVWAKGVPVWRTDVSTISFIPWKSRTLHVAHMNSSCEIKLISLHWEVLEKKKNNRKAGISWHKSSRSSKVSV